ncbi:MAG: hypothetical protein IJ272_00355 [Clostridia bacterium]|nr:hypothetical protein [Clostridia bacterium]
MNEYIRGTAQFMTSHIVGRSDAWRDGYLAAFYGKGDEACEGKSAEYVTDFMKGYKWQYETLAMHAWANRLRRRQL